VDVQIVNSAQPPFSSRVERRPSRRDLLRRHDHDGRSRVHSNSGRIQAPSGRLPGDFDSWPRRSLTDENEAEPKAGGGRRALRPAPPLAALIVVAGSLALLTLTVLTTPSRKSAVLLLLIALAALVAQSSLRIVSWRSLIVSVIVVIFAIPIRRYTLPASLPIELEPYRLLVFLIAAGWFASLLADPRVRLRRSGFEDPIAVFFNANFPLGYMGTTAVSVHRALHSLESGTRCALFFLSFLIVFFLIVSTVRLARDVAFLSAILVASASVVGFLTLLEARTGVNAFSHIGSIIPVLRPLPFIAEGVATDNRGGAFAFGSAQHRSLERGVHHAAATGCGPRAHVKDVADACASWC
jgi:hypothetical protein